MTGEYDTDLLLRVPPFPGKRTGGMTGSRPRSTLDRASLSEILEGLRSARVGGTYWARQPILPPAPYIVLRANSTAQAAEMLAQAQRRQDTPGLMLWLPQGIALEEAPEGCVVVLGDADPWHMLSGATALWADGEDEAAFIAAVLGVRLRLFGTERRFAPLAEGGTEALEIIARQLLLEPDWTDPFTGAPCPVERIIGYCAEWRRLIDANRPIAAAFGFGEWKKETVDALLWGGTQAHTAFMPAKPDRLDTLPPDAAVALWKARVPAPFLAACEASPHPVHEVEDGFIRSVGLGADCVPPLSIIVDPVGVHYDPSGPSGLENLLAQHTFAPELLERAPAVARADPRKPDQQIWHR